MHYFQLDQMWKLAALEPGTVAAGHSDPVSGEPSEMRMMLEQAAIRG